MHKQELKLGARILENLPDLTTKQKQYWIDNPKALKQWLADLQLTEKPLKPLCRLEILTLAPTRGETTLYSSTNIFTGERDHNLLNWGTDITGVDTGIIKVDVYEMVPDGSYRSCKKMFASLGNPQRLCFTQGQIVEFCCTHKTSLVQGGPRTFFLFAVCDVLFVAYVIVGRGGFVLRVNRFHDNYAWSAQDRHRLVVPHATTT